MSFEFETEGIRKCNTCGRVLIGEWDHDPVNCNNFATDSEGEDEDECGYYRK